VEFYDLLIEALIDPYLAGEHLQGRIFVLTAGLAGRRIASLARTVFSSAVAR
jgi:hypothetical protein